MSYVLCSYIRAWHMGICSMSLYHTIDDTFALMDNLKLWFIWVRHMGKYWVHS